jgi:hypothetical protein
VPTNTPFKFPPRSMVPLYGKLTVQTVATLSVAEELRNLADMLQAGRQLHRDRLALWFRDTAEYLDDLVKNAPERDGPGLWQIRPVSPRPRP